jgi:hypothetical protein
VTEPVPVRAVPVPVVRALKRRRGARSVPLEPLEPNVASERMECESEDDGDLSGSDRVASARLRLSDEEEEMSV